MMKKECSIENQICIFLYRDVTIRINLLLMKNEIYF